MRRLFANKKQAELMLWHATRNKVDSDVPRHPADGMQWQSINAEYQDFGGDPRNIRFGMSTDGLNPFGNMSYRFSTWPAVLWMYNLPLWLYLKRKYIQLCMLIQGPKQPGSDLHMYHQLLYEELRTLWDGPPVKVWDAYMREYFDLKALLFVTVQDYPALVYQSGQVVHGYKACVLCKEHTTTHRLAGSSKILYMGHRRWLKETDE